MDASVGTQDNVGPTGPTASSGQPWPGAVVTVTETVVEQVVAALARAYGLDRKTVRTWGRYGGYRPRARRPTVSQLDPYRAWMTQRAPEVGFNAAVVCRELRELEFVGSSVIVRRTLHPLRVAATPSRATVRFETAPGAQAQVDFGQVRVWIGDILVPAQIFVMTLGYSRRGFAVAFLRQRLHKWLVGHELAFQHFGA